MSNRTSTFVLRSVLGLIFVVGPLGTAFHAVPEPVLPPGAAAFAAALANSGYMMPLLWTTELAAGALLLLGVAVPLALVLLAPVIVNIFAFHAFLAPAGRIVAVLLGAMELVLAWRYRDAFLPLLGGAPNPAQGDAVAMEVVP